MVRLRRPKAASTQTTDESLVIFLLKRPPWQKGKPSQKIIQTFIIRAQEGKPVRADSQEGVTSTESVEKGGKSSPVKTIPVTTFSVWNSAQNARGKKLNNMLKSLSEPKLPLRTKKRPRGKRNDVEEEEEVSISSDHNEEDQPHGSSFQVGHPTKQPHPVELKKGAFNKALADA